MVSWFSMGGKKLNIAVGLSGGVDSAAAALILKEEGHHVTGINMRLFDGPAPGDGGKAQAERIGKVQAEHNGEAQQVARQLGIPFFEIDLRKEYESLILGYIRDDYRSGRTPNPCVRCNREIKFGLFLEKARRVVPDFDRFATGHYAVIEDYPPAGRKALRSGLYAEKDQAYFLSLLTQEQLARTLFPLGKMTKPQVRELCRRAGLEVHKKKESQDLCLGEYRGFLPEGEGQGPGDFLDTAGRVLGRHRGIENYTIGQRRGLGIGGGEPLYVLAIRREDNTVVLGTDGELLAGEMVIRDINWGIIEEPALPFRGRVKIRYRDEGSPAVLEEFLGDGRWRVVFAEPRRAVTPGQLAVFYHGDYVAFAGFIDTP